nr:MAG TPA: neurotoxin [Bacteriophage sp.]
MNLNEQLSKLVKDKFREEIQKLPLSSISYLNFSYEFKRTVI